MSEFRKLPKGFLFDLSSIAQAFNMTRPDAEIKDGVMMIKCPNPDHHDNNPSCTLHADGIAVCHGCDYTRFIDTAIAQFDANVKKSQYAFSADSVWHQLVEMFPELRTFDYSPLHHSLLLEGRERWLTHKDKIYETVLNPRGIWETDVDFGCSSDGSEIQIPVYDEAGNLVNIRTYIPNPKPGQQKFYHHKGAPKPEFIYPMSELVDIRQDTLVIAGGELKALAGIEAAQREDISQVKFISFTCGEGNFPGPLVKKVCSYDWANILICYDVDEAGQKGAIQLQELLLEQLTQSDKQINVGVINLPLDKSKHPKGDLNDFLAEGGKMGLLISEAIKTAITPDMKVSDPVRDHNLNDAVKIDLLKFIEEPVSPNVTYSVDAVVVETSSDTRVLAPTQFKIKCRRDQAECNKCPRNTEPLRVFKIDVIGDHAFKSDEKNMDRAALRRAGVPESCKKCSIDKTDESFKETHVAEYVISNPVVGDNNQRRSVQCVQFEQAKQAVAPGGRYRFLGAITSTGNATFHVLKNQPFYQEILDSIDYEKIKVRARPIADTPASIGDKLSSLALDLSKLISISYRSTTVMYADLVFHSAAEMPNMRNEPELGALNMLVVGDSGTGKTSIMDAMSKYYEQGEIIDCANATYAGLAAGVSPDSKATVRWGALVANDRGLVILEEMAELNRGKENADILNALKQIRSSGKMTINKIAKGSANARTRLIAVSNASQAIGRFNRGWEALQDVSPDEASLRRFAFIQVLRTLDADINAFDKPPKRINRTTDQQLLIWAWTRESRHIQISRETYDELEKQSGKLRREFSDAKISPIGNFISETLKKVAVAIAIRLFSTQDNEHVIVKPAHAEAAYDIIHDMYLHEDLGIKQTLLRGNIERRIRKINARIDAAPSTGALIHRIANGNSRAAYDRDLAQDVDWLVHHNYAKWTKDKLVLDEAIESATLDNLIDLPNLQEDDFDRTNSD